MKWNWIIFENTKKKIEEEKEKALRTRNLNLWPNDFCIYDPKTGRMNRASFNHNAEVEREYKISLYHLNNAEKDLQEALLAAIQQRAHTTRREAERIWKFACCYRDPYSVCDALCQYPKEFIYSSGSNTTKDYI